MKNREVKVHGFFGLTVEPQERGDFLHAFFSFDEQAILCFFVTLHTLDFILFNNKKHANNLLTEIFQRMQRVRDKRQIMGSYFLSYLVRPNIIQKDFLLSKRTDGYSFCKMVTESFLMITAMFSR
jgi:hypothetical protein